MARIESTPAHYANACGLVARLAARLLQRLPPIDVAGALVAAAINVLVDSLGKERAVRYLRDIATETENDDYEPPRLN